MRKVVVVLLLAGVLVLALAASAMAVPQNDNSEMWFGQLHKAANWNFVVPPDQPKPAAEFTPGHREANISPYPGNPGESISGLIADIHDDGLHDEDGNLLPVKSYGEFVTNGLKGPPPTF